MFDNQSASHRLMHAFFRLGRLQLWRPAADGLRPPEVHLLRLLDQGSENTESGLKVSELSQRMHVTPSMVTQVVKILEARGLVARTMDTEDRRAVRVSITCKGVQALEQTISRILSAFDALAAHLGPEKSAKLADLLAEVHDFAASQESPVSHHDPCDAGQQAAGETNQTIKQAETPDRGVDLQS